MIDPVSGAVFGGVAGAATNHVTEPILAKIPFVYKFAAVASLFLFLIWHYYGKKIQGRKRR